MNAARTIIALIFISLTAPSAYAYDSIACRPGLDDCEGLEAARTPWMVSEHARIWLRARELAGLPAAIDAPFTVRTPLSGREVEGLESFEATPLDLIVGLKDRTIELAVFAQLPDKSYSLWDWTSGNEGCPATEGLGFADCHAFAAHMGWLNSNHFLPQAEQMFQHYHAFALERARHCADMKRALEMNERAEPVLLESCDREALLLEAIAQHFLQDAWSMGHMWQRWGSPRLEDFPANLRGADARVGVKAVGDAVGRGSGIIHGAKAVIPFINDAMCTPDEGIEFIHDGAKIPGGGDLFLDRVDADARLEGQRNLLYDCATSSMREVYLASARSFGEPRANQQRTIDLQRCFTQRATNAAIALGAAIQLPRAATLTAISVARIFVTLFPALLPAGISGAAVEVALDAHLEFVSANYLAQIEQPGNRGDLYLPLTSETLTRVLGAASIIDPNITTLWHNDMARIQVALISHAVDGPSQTQLANGAMGPLLTMRRNGDYDARTTPYLDPELPWTPTRLTMPQPALREFAPDILTRTFTDAHTTDWCEVMTKDGEGEHSLRALKDRCRDEKLEPKLREIACQVCGERANPHIREMDYDGVVVEESLCTILGVPGAATIDIAPTMEIGLGDKWCREGCLAGEFIDLPLIGKLRCVPAGMFIQGCVPGRDDLQEPCQPGSTPARPVIISEAVWMMEREMNAAVVAGGGIPQDHCGSIPLEQCPARDVSWFIAGATADALSMATQLPPCGTDSTVNPSCEGWRLPTEAEFEYAARGGEELIYPGSNDPSLVAVVGELQPSCSKQRNGFGLCDMSGSLREWVLDGYFVTVGVGESDPQQLPLGIPPYQLPVPPEMSVTDPFGGAAGETTDFVEIRAARGGNLLFAQRCSDRDWAIAAVEHVHSGGSISSGMMGFRLVVNAR